MSVAGFSRAMEPSERTANERIEALAEPIRNLAAALDLLRRYQIGPAS